VHWPHGQANGARPTVTYFTACVTTPETLASRSRDTTHNPKFGRHETMAEGPPLRLVVENAGSEWRFGTSDSPQTPMVEHHSSSSASPSALHKLEQQLCAIQRTSCRYQWVGGELRPEPRTQIHLGSIGHARVGNVGFGLGLLATRRIEPSQLIFNESPICTISQDPKLQMLDPKIRPLLLQCMLHKDQPAKVRQLMGQVTEINAKRAFESLSLASQQAWMSLLDAFSIAPGGRVRIMGLTSAAGERFNGLEATVLHYDTVKDRWSVRLLLDDTEVAIRAQNLDGTDSKTAGGIVRTNSYGFKSDLTEAGVRGAGFTPGGGNTPVAMDAGLYQIACRANHSCSPNVRKEFLEGGRMRVYATKPIGEGAEILCCYGGSHLPVAQRRDYLKSRYAFWCKCDRCRTEAGECSASVCQ
jgi:hypothetical protein